MRNSIAWLLFVSLAVCARGETIIVSPEVLDLGILELGESEHLDGRIKVENVTAEKIALTAIKVSCGCLQVVDHFKSLEGGASGEVLIRVTPEATPRLKSTKRLTLLFGEDRAIRRSVLINWSVRHPLSVTPHEIKFTEDGLQQSAAAVGIGGAAA